MYQRARLTIRKNKFRKWRVLSLGRMMMAGINILRVVMVVRMIAATQ